MRSKTHNKTFVYPSLKENYQYYQVKAGDALMLNKKKIGI